MRRILWSAAALAGLVACGEDGPTRAPFGLDKRPTNTTCLARARPVIDTGVTVQRQWTGLTFNQPIYLAQAPDDDATWYVVERGGRIRAFPANATSNTQSRVFAQVTVNAAGEGGLLGFAFHPEWPARREAYLSYTRSLVTGDPATQACPGANNPFTSVVARFRSTNNGMSLDSGPDEILKLGQPYSNHNGGTIQFGPDGMLYFGLGDGGSGDDPCGAGQDMGTLLGKVLRVDVNAPAGRYEVPPDNPFVGTPGARPEIWASGFRNPWRWSFDRESGEMWIGDVGQGAWEEIDRVVKGGNYGWKTCEGFHRRGSTSVRCGTPGLLDPVVAHGRTEARSITGGYVYRGTAMPSLVGTYIYGDYETGNIWALLYDADNKPAPKLLATVDPNLVSFAQGNDGEIYTVQISGIISKLVPSAPPPPDDFPRLLSETGCFDPKDPTRPGPALIPYDVNAPLWSDGGDKERWFAIPDGATIAINAEEDWELPIGSVAVKTFSVGGKRIETRLFMRHEDGGWGGYTYEWNESGTDATLLPGAKVKALDDGAAAWSYPSRNQCLQCHSKAAGGTLGFETAQLNREAVYPSTNRLSNQLATLDHIGMLSAPLASAPADAPRLADPLGKEPLEARARAYLHANCAHCHRPEGGGQGTMDLRYTRSLQETQTCNVDNTQGPLGGATKLIAPGAPGSSVLSLRIHATDGKRMPPVAVSVIDQAGSAVIDDWIGSLTACP